jgi:hypothetical protein
LPFFVATYFTKLKNFLLLKRYRIKFEPIDEDFWYFLRKKLAPGPQKKELGFGIWEKPIPDPGVRKAPDQGSGSATLSVSRPQSTFF